MLLEEFLKPLGMTQQSLATEIKVPYQRVNELVNKRRGITPGTALRLSRLFGTTPDYWLSLQLRWDLYFAQTKEAKILKAIHPLRTAV
jgi:addiction module HigA family antidote